MEKQGETYLFGKGKGILSEDLEIAICFCLAKLVVAVLTFPLLRQLLRVWFPSAAAAEADAVCDPGVVRPC